METTTTPRTRTGARTPAATLALICTGYFMAAGSPGNQADLRAMAA